MNAHAAAMRYPRAPAGYHRASARSAPPRRRYAGALNAPHGVLAGAPTSWDLSRSALSRSLPAWCLPSFPPLGAAWTKVAGASAAIVHWMPVDIRTIFKLGAAAVTGAIVVLAIVNNQRSDTDAWGFPAARNETVVYRQMPTGKLAIEDEGEPTGIESEEHMPASYPRTVQTVTFANSSPPNATGFAAFRARVMEKVGAFIAFPGKQSAEQTVSAEWTPIFASSSTMPVKRWMRRESNGRC